MSSGSFENNINHELFLYRSYIFNIYMYKQYLALDNQQGLMCHKKFQPTNQPTKNDG